MKRRDFLARILQLAGLAVAPSVNAAAPSVSTTSPSATAAAASDNATPSASGAPPSDAAEPRAPLLLQSSAVAGFPYHQGEVVWSSLRQGAALTLTREPHNRHDYRAIRVDWQGHKLGYVPRVENATLASLMDRGYPIEARILALRESDDPWQRVEMEIWLAAERPRG